MNKLGRNDPCSCGSGKKFKKCCEGKSKHKKINAQLLSETPEPVLKEASAMASLFKRSVALPAPLFSKEPGEEKNAVM